MSRSCPRLALLALFILAFSPVRAAEPSTGPYLATGIKIGEPTAESAIVWVRLTRNPDRVPNTVPMPSVTYVNPATSETRNSVTGRQRPDFAPIVRYPDRLTVETIQGAGRRQGAE